MQRTLLIGSTLAGSIGLLAAALVATPAAAAPKYIEKEVLAGSSEAQAIASLLGQGAAPGRDPLQRRDRRRGQSTSRPAAHGRHQGRHRPGDRRREEVDEHVQEREPAPDQRQGVLHGRRRQAPLVLGHLAAVEAPQPRAPRPASVVTTRSATRPPSTSGSSCRRLLPGQDPWGIYVGKQGFTHYDYDVYEDGDRNLRRSSPSTTASS